MVEEFFQAYDGHESWAQLGRSSNNREECKGKWKMQIMTKLVHLTSLSSKLSKHKGAQIDFVLGDWLEKVGCVLGLGWRHSSARMLTLKGWPLTDLKELTLIWFTLL